MKNEKAARHSRLPTPSRPGNSVARAGSVLDVVDFLLEEARADPEDEARRLFPGPLAIDRYRRMAFLEIVATMASCAAAGDWLERVRDTIGRELREIDSESRPSALEDGLEAAAERFQEAARASRRAGGFLHRARLLSPRRRRKLKVIS